MMIRYIINDEMIDEYVIDDENKVHHLKVVLKLNVGELIYLVNEKKVGEYEIVSINNQIRLLKKNEWIEENELNIKVDLAISPLKKNNTEFVVQKAVELGVNDIYLTNFTRSIAKYLKDERKNINKKEKFDKIVIGAMEQSRRNYQTQIHLGLSLTDIDFTTYDKVFLCYENKEEDMLINHYEEIKKNRKILLIVGPEGGIEENEIKQLEGEVEVVSLGKRILRAETAAVNGLSIIAAIDEGKI